MRNEQEAAIYSNVSGIKPARVTNQRVTHPLPSFPRGRNMLSVLLKEIISTYI